MSYRAQFFMRFMGLSILLLSVPLILFFVSELFANPKGYNVEIANFEDVTDIGSKSLPYVSNGNRAFTKVSGKVAFSGASLQTPIYAYIPRFDGYLRVYSKGMLIFADSSPLWISRSGSALFEIPVAKDQDFVELSFSLEERSKPFIRLSRIFLGELAPLNRHLMNSLWLSTWTPLVFACLNVFTLFAFFVIYVYTPELHRKLYARRLVPLIMVSVYIFGMLILSSNLFYLDPKLPIIWTVLFAPGLVMNFWIAGRYFGGWECFGHSMTAQGAAFFLGLSLLCAIFVIQDSLRMLPLVISGAILIVGLASLTFLSVLDFSMGRGFHSAISAIGFLIFLCCVAHDALMRLDFFIDQYFLAGIGMSVFTMMNLLYFFKIVQDTSERQSQSTRTLNRALEERSIELNCEYQRNSILLANQAVYAEKQRIMQDLHDGVLSYLSVINVLTEGNVNGELSKINSASRWASNEIRLLMEAGDSRNLSLLVAITNLRRQFIDRLSELGVHIEYDLGALVGLPDLDFKIVIETIRIMQEAIHNAVFRANCSILKISASVTTEDQAVGLISGFKIVIVNEGGGSYSRNLHLGNGVRNMYIRANRIDASFEIVSMDGGAILSLEWPC